MTSPVFEAWIDIGETSGMYTLHRRVVDRPFHDMVKEYTYVRNVGRTWETACQNADKWLAQNPCEHIKKYSISDNEGTLRERGKYDDDQLWFGMYAGSSIDSLVENQPEYLKWVRDEMRSDDPRFICLKEKLVAMNLGRSRAVIERERIEAEKAAQKAREDAIKKPIPVELEDGRVTMTGEILFTYRRDTQYGTVTKMMFLDDRGFKLCGTAPSALWDIFGTKIESKRIQFDAAITISDDDECFGFFKRPTKVEESV